jgi:hypothetical protein
VRIRQFGFLANRARGKKLALCRILLDSPPPTTTAVIDGRKIEEPDDRLCPACKIGQMILVRIVPLARLAAPAPAATP